jgi:phenylalanyl-tRNA synthetase beta chain
MKISLNWVKEYLDFDLPPLDQLVEKIGAQLGAVDEVVDLGQKYQGIIIAKVVSCEKHPNADKLNLCKIDDGGVVKSVERDADDHVQVVCGAPNVRAGLMVAWLPPGTTLPESFGKDPFVLETRELRGQQSNGMLASPKELAIGDSHAGILEVDYECQPGADFADIYKLNDYIIDIENKMFTHRPDCFGILGVAREIAGICGHQFKSPNWYATFTEKLTPAGDALPLVVQNDLPDLVPRFMAVVISAIELQPSSVWIQSYLSRLGVRPINNVVDVTNYMMLLTGQPLHAYDYDKVRAQDPDAQTATLTIRKPRSGEKLTLLNGKEIEPRAEAILIATATQAIGLGGVMGGATTEIDANTKNIILECATFDMYSIRRTSMAHGFFTDAVTRFNKGQSPLQNDRVILQSAEMLLTGTAEYASSLIDDNHLSTEIKQRNSVHPAVKLDMDFINQRLGLKLVDKDMETLLGNVEFRVSSDEGQRSVTAPFWRTDIELREDIVEEIGRLYGYDKLPLTLPERDLTPPSKDPLFELKAKIRASLSRAGANEVLTYSFVHGDLLDKVGQDKSQAFQVSNALSPDLQYYRQSLTPSLLEKIHFNSKAGYNEFVLFELGKGHSTTALDGASLPREFEQLGLVFAADAKTAKQQYAGAAFYQAKAYLQTVLRNAHMWRATRYVPFDELDIAGNERIKQLAQPFEPARSALVCDNKDIIWGVVGEYKASVRRALKLPDFCAGFELEDIERLGFSWPDEARYQTLSRFPQVTQDLTLRIAAEVSYDTLSACLGVALAGAHLERGKSRLELIDIFQPEGETDHKHLTFRLTIASYERTLTDAEVSKLLDDLAVAAKDKLSAERI